MARLPVSPAMEDPLLQRRRLTLILGVLLVLAFTTASMVSYVAARRGLDNALVDKELPLTSAVVVAELKHELVRPYLMASMMATDTFLQDWIAAGERDPGRVIRYLRDIRDRNRLVSSFFVSESTRIYYHADGILKRVSPSVPIDRWYFRVSDMRHPYEINVDNDSAGPGLPVVFYNHRIVDGNGRYLGATGVGVALSRMQALLRQVGERYHSRLYLTDGTGRVRMAGESALLGQDIHSLKGLKDVAGEALQADGNFRYRDARGVIYLHVQYLPDIGMYLFVEGRSDEGASGVQRAFYFSVVLWVVVVLVTIFLTDMTVRRFRRRLEVMASVDHLTGLMNRQTFEQACVRRLDASRRGGYPVTLAIVDLDYFRQINDRYGHPGGDQVLRQVAALLMEHMRGGDLLCRWGGEEFLVLFDRCGEGEAERLAEGLRCHLATHEFTLGGRPQRLTMSVGLAESLPDDTLQRMIGRADRALFIAKDAGRNRVQAGA